MQFYLWDPASRQWGPDFPDEIYFGGEGEPEGPLFEFRKTLPEGTSFTVRAECWQFDAKAKWGYAPTWYRKGVNEPGEPDWGNNSWTVSDHPGYDREIYSFGEIEVVRNVGFSGKVVLPPGSPLPANDAGGIEAEVFLCQPGATACDLDDAGFVKLVDVDADGTFNTWAFPGRYDLWLRAKGSGVYVYPERVTRLDNLDLRKSRSRAVLKLADARQRSTTKASFGKLRAGVAGTVTVKVGPGGNPTGTVVLSHGAKVLAQRDLVRTGKGKVTLRFTVPAKGKHNLTVSFSGDDGYEVSTRTYEVKVR